MKILWVATKAPWPQIDGGRVLLYNTLRALADAGHELTLLAPVTASDSERAGIVEKLAPLCRPVLIEARKRALMVDALRAQVRRLPLTIVRHAAPALRRRAAELIAEEGPAVVVAEQVQALDAVSAAWAQGLPVVLREQNVESDLWSQSARQATWRRLPLALEARRLAAWEGRAIARCAATVALTAEDRDRLAALAGTARRLHHVPAPFELELPAADEPLSGSPPVVLFGSGGWRPNAGGAAWFLSEVWPKMRAAAPSARLHVFGLPAAGPGVVAHPAPRDSREAYPPGAVLVVPLRVASGVRIKILEAWARGVPVIATPAAARGLAAEDGRHLLLSSHGDDFAKAVRRLSKEPELAARLIAGGRQQLREQHALSRVAARLREIFEAL